MKILCLKTMPNGSAASSHKIDSIAITPARMSVNVLSYTADDVLCWSDTLDLDDDVIVGDPMNDVASWLMSGYLAGGSIMASQTPEDVLRLTLLKRVDRLREKKVEGGCVTGLGRVKSDEVSIRNLLGAVQTATLAQMTSQPFEMAWRMEDNTLVNVNAPEMIALGMTVMEHVQRCYQISWEIKDFLNEATIEEIEGIDLEFEWDRIAAE